MSCMLTGGAGQHVGLWACQVLATAAAQGRSSCGAGMHLDKALKRKSPAHRLSPITSNDAAQGRRAAADEERCPFPSLVRHCTGSACMLSGPSCLPAGRSRRASAARRRSAWPSGGGPHSGRWRRCRRDLEGCRGHAEERCAPPGVSGRAARSGSKRAVAFMLCLDCQL